jgi:hypothetical protein
MSFSVWDSKPAARLSIDPSACFSFDLQLQQATALPEIPIATGEFFARVPPVSCCDFSFARVPPVSCCDFSVSASSFITSFEDSNLCLVPAGLVLESSDLRFEFLKLFIVLSLWFLDHAHRCSMKCT